MKTGWPFLNSKLITPKRVWTHEPLTNTFKVEGEGFRITGEYLEDHLHGGGAWIRFSHESLGNLLDRIYNEVKGSTVTINRSKEGRKTKVVEGASVYFDARDYLHLPGVSGNYLTLGEQKMPLVDLQLTPIPPVVDPCAKEQEDRPFTQQEIARAVADLVDFIAEQGVFNIKNLDIENLEESPISPITE